MAVTEDKAWLKREGRIKTGIKLPSGAPKNVDYFVCPQVVYDALGVTDKTKLKELPIYFTTDDRDQCFKVDKKKYNRAGDSSILTCRCNIPREQLPTLNDNSFTADAWRLQPDNTTWAKTDCNTKCPFRWPTEKNGRPQAPACKSQGQLMFMIDGVASTGCWEFDAKSNSVIKDIESVLKTAQIQFGRLEGIPFILYTKKIGSGPRTGFIVSLKLDPRFAAAIKPRNPYLAAIERGETIDLTAPVPAAPVATEAPSDEEDWKELWAEAQKTGRDKQQLLADVAEAFPGKTSPRELSKEQIREVIDRYQIEAELLAQADLED